MSNGDMKAGLTSNRVRLSILPRTGLNYGCRGIEYGGDKYVRGNYHRPPPPNVAAIERLLGYIDAAQRHLTATTDAINRALGTGGDLATAAACADTEPAPGFPASNLPHLAHAIASLLIGVTCAADDGLLPADPGTPWKAHQPDRGLPQKDNPVSERKVRAPEPEPPPIPVPTEATGNRSCFSIGDKCGACHVPLDPTPHRPDSAPRWKCRLTGREVAR